MLNETACPQDVLGWIPWYPDQGLDESQRGAVEAHAAGCARCRDEIALVVGGVEVPDPPVADAVWDDVLTRVRASERSPAVPAVSAAPPRRSAPTHRPVRRVLAAAALAVVCAGLGALAAVSLVESGQPIYTTAAGPASGAGADGMVPLLDVVFRDDVDVIRLREALRAVNGQIVSGPTELGRYQVQLGPGADALAAARALASGEAGVAIYAEPAPR